MARINGVALGAVGTGAILLWSGIKGTSVLASIQDIIQGRKPRATQANPIATGGVSLGNGGGSTGSGDTSAHNASAATAQNYARLLGQPLGWSSGQQWADWVSLWNQESGWSNTAENPNSGALGIAQALPPTKYPRAGQKPTLDYRAQIRWGMRYILQRYTSPSKAWAHEQEFRWY